MSEAYEEPDVLCNKKLSQLYLDDFPGKVKQMSMSSFINVAYTLAERWDVATCDAGATSTKAKYTCCKVGARSMGAIHLFPSVKEAKKIKKSKNLKKVVRFLLLVLEKLEEKYSDLYSRRSWPKASAKPKAPVSAPTPVAVELTLPECAFGPDAIPGQSNVGLVENSPTNLGVENSPVSGNDTSDVKNDAADVTMCDAADLKPAKEIPVPEPVQSTTEAMSAMSLSDAQQPEAKPTSMISWENVNTKVESFPRVLNKLKQLIAKHVFQDQAEIIPNTFSFKVAKKVDMKSANDRLSRLMSKVVEQINDELDTALQLSLHKTAASSRLTMCN